MKYEVTGKGLEDLTYVWTLPVYGSYNIAGVDEILFAKVIVKAAAKELRRQGLQDVKVLEIFEETKLVED